MVGRPGTRYDRILVENLAISSEAHVKWELLVDTKFQAHLTIPFICKCTNTASKTISAARKSGMLCAACVKKTPKKREKFESLPIDVSLVYILNIAGTESVIGLQDRFMLCVANEYRTKSFSGPHGDGHRKPHFTVKYWDVTEFKYVQKRVYVIENGVDQAKRICQSILQQQPEVQDADTIVLSVREILLRQHWCQTYLRMSTPVRNFLPVQVPLDAYILGSWLGDGDAKAAILTNTDDQVLSYWRQWSSEQGYRIRTAGKDRFSVSNERKKENPGSFLTTLRDMELYGNKHVPREYIENSKSIRLSVLAGLLDTDGSLSTSRTAYDFVQSAKHEQIFDDLVEIAASLGMNLTKKSCVKTCMYKGERKDCPAFRGLLTGPAALLREIPLQIDYKKKLKTEEIRHDLLRFAITRR